MLRAEKHHAEKAISYDTVHEKQLLKRARHIISALHPLSLFFFKYAKMEVHTEGNGQV